MIRRLHLPLASALFLLLAVGTDLRGQWNPIGPTSIEMHSFAANSHYIFGGVWFGNYPLFRSSDHGATWHENFVSPSGKAASLAPIYADDNVVLLVQESTELFFRSTDNGESWHEIDLPETGRVGRLTSCAEVDGLLYCLFDNLKSTEDLHYSLDTGRTWQAVVDANYDPINGANLLAFRDTLIFFGVKNADGRGAIYALTDTGRTLEARYLPEEERPSSVVVSGDHLVLFSFSWRGLWYSEDAGRSWTAADMPEVPLLDFRPLALIAGGDHILAPSGEWSLYSEDNGRTWSRVDSTFPYIAALPPELPRPSWPLHGIWTGNGFLLGHGDRVGNFGSATGHSWEPFGTGLPQDRVIEGLASRGEEILVHAKEQFRSTDAGKTWWPNYARVRGRGPLFATTDGYLRGRGDRVARSSDGNEWEEIEGSPADVIHFSRDGSMIYATTLREIWRSSDEGRTWNQLLLPDGQRSAVFAADGTIVSVERALYRSFDDGNTWERVLGTDPPAWWIIESMAQSGSHFFGVNGSQGLLVVASSDAGRTWQDITERIPVDESRHPFFEKASIFAFDSLVVLTAYSNDGRGDFRSHLCMSQDYGESWILIDSDSGVSPRGSIPLMIKIGDRLIAYLSRTSTVGDGLFDLDLSQALPTSVGEQEGRSPTATGSTPETTMTYDSDRNVLRWQAARQGKATIHVVDLLGRTVDRHEGLRVEPGYQEHPLSLEHLSPGYYIVLLEIDRHQSGRLSIVR